MRTWRGPIAVGLALFLFVVGVGLASDWVDAHWHRPFVTEAVSR